MSAWFAKIKCYYDKGLWSEAAVKQAVVKHRITAEEYEIITGQPYGAA